MGETQLPQSAGVNSTASEAATELARIQQLQERVIKTTLVPVWYWWVMAAGMVTIGAARDSHDPLVLAIAIPLAVLVMVGVTAWMIPECRRQVRVHHSKQPGRGPGPGAGMALFVLIVLVNVVTILTCVSLAATQVSLSPHHRLRRRSRRARDRWTTAERISAQTHVEQRRARAEPRTRGQRHNVNTAGFDELIHAPTRLEIVSLLAAAQWANFKYIRDELGLSDSALSEQLSTLESAGYVEISKGFVGKRPRTSVRLSKTGRKAFEQHVAALQRLVARSQPDVRARKPVNERLVNQNS